MEKTTKKFIEDLKAEITYTQKLLDWSVGHLAKYPHDKYEAQYIARYNAFIARATSYLKAVER